MPPPSPEDRDKKHKQIHLPYWPNLVMAEVWKVLNFISQLMWLLIGVAGDHKPGKLFTRQINDT